eukprot:10811339-Alexandrium_andersonii.AAC.1
MEVVATAIAAARSDRRPSGQGQRRLAAACAGASDTAKGTRCVQRSSLGIPSPRGRAATRRLPLQH